MRRHEVGDADWERIEPLLPRRGPEGGRRRFVNAVLWVARTGAAWRDLPERLGNWNSVWRRFSRWADAGVWGRVLDAVRDPDLEVLVLDSTAVRAHPAAAGAKKSPAGRRPRRSAAAGAGSGRRSTAASTGSASRSP